MTQPASPSVAGAVDDAPQWADRLPLIRSMYAVLRIGNKRILELADLPLAPSPAAACEHFQIVWRRKMKQKK